MNKFVIVGGGSAYTPDILATLLRDAAAFAGWEWVLHDVDERSAAIIAALARRMVRAVGADIRVRHTLDREDALTGARFVLAQPRVGGLKARALDEKIPLRHGVIGQETIGPGGFAFAWRTIPVMVAVVQTMQRVAPDGWLISYANPAGMVTEAIIRTWPQARFIGLCDMPTGLQWGMGQVLRVDPHRLELDYRGINHGGWVASVRRDGEVDVLPRLRQTARWWPAGLLPLNEWTGAVRLFRRHGQVPDPYLRYYYFRDEMLRHLRRSARTRAEVVQAKVRNLYDHFAVQARADLPSLRIHRGHASHFDLAASLIRTMVRGGRSRFVIQQQNPGIGGLLPGHAAQFPALVGPDGWTPLPAAPLPEAEGELIRTIQAAEAANVTAALTGSREEAVAAAAANPLVPSRKLAERLVDELLQAHRPYLPQFFS